MKPRLAEMIEESIEKLVETGAVEPNPAGANQGTETVRTVMNKNVKGIEYVRRDGSIALAGIRVVGGQPETTKTLELKLRHLDGYWQVAEITNPTVFNQK
jgi:hypothetical protein